jgi:hypothetical protein
MAPKHGSKHYFQVLIDVARCELLEEMAAKAGLRTTSLIRDMVYDALEKKLPASIYNEAKAKDEALWAQSVRKRIEGRQASARARKAAAEVPQE